MSPSRKIYSACPENPFLQKQFLSPPSLNTCSNKMFIKKEKKVYFLF